MMPAQMAERLQAPISKAEAGALAGHLSTRQADLLQFFALLASDQPGVAWRMAWILATLAERRFEAPKGYAEGLAQALAKTAEPAVARCIGRALLALAPYGHELEGIVADACLAWLDDPSVPVSTASMMIDLYLELCIRYPELWRELEPRLERLSRNEGTGWAATLGKARRFYHLNLARKH